MLASHTNLKPDCLIGLSQVLCDVPWRLLLLYRNVPVRNAMMRMEARGG